MPCWGGVSIEFKNALETIDGQFLEKILPGNVPGIGMGCADWLRLVKANQEKTITG
jgi:hypothetical protein